MLLKIQSTSILNKKSCLTNSLISQTPISKAQKTGLYQRKTLFPFFINRLILLPLFSPERDKDPWKGLILKKERGTPLGECSEFLGGILESTASLAKKNQRSLKEASKYGKKKL